MTCISQLLYSNIIIKLILIVLVRRFIRATVEDRLQYCQVRVGILEKMKLNDFRVAEEY